jgi:hypothetical protein
MERPDATTLDRIKAAATTRADAPLKMWLDDRKNSRAIPHRLESCDYVPVRNEDARDGLWRINGRRQAVYARTDLPLQDRILAARALT